MIATGEDPEYLEEICNMAVDLLVELDSSVYIFRVLEYAGPAQLVGTD